MEVAKFSGWESANFLWEAPLDGDSYEWTEVEEHQWEPSKPTKPAKPNQRAQHRPKKELALVRRPDTRFRRYAPIEEEPCLFRVFAETELTQEGFLGFANRYGSLTAAPSEGVKFWFAETYEMKELVNLWDKVQQGDREGLQSYIQWGEEGHVWYVPPPPPEGIPASWRWQRHPFDLRCAMGIEGSGSLPVEKIRTRPGDVIWPVRSYLQRVIDRWMLFSFKIRMAWDDRGYGRYQLAPGDLLGVIRMQFAQAVAEQKQYRRCVVCGHWLELTPRVSRADRLTCSNSCRMALYRQRQERAREMHAQGASALAIAKELEADPDAVRNWIRGKS